MRKIKNNLSLLVDIFLFVLAIAFFCYSGYKIASHYGIIKAEEVRAESCGECSTCEGDNWGSELCRKIHEWCGRVCNCHQTPTPPPQPIPTISEPTSTPAEPTPTTILPTSTPIVVHPTNTLVPQLENHDNNQGGGGGGGGGNPGPCTPPEAPKSPELISAVNVAGGARLTWGKVDRADHYLVFYGLSSRNYIYGNSDVGNSDSYIVGNLEPGKTYFFAVSAGIGGGCPVASPYSNELSNRYYSKTTVLGVQVEDPPTESDLDLLGDGISTEAGEVLGTKEKSACPVWWMVLIGQTILLGVVYAVWIKKEKYPRRWWLLPVGTVFLAYLIDWYAHNHWFVLSWYCPWEKWLGVGLAGIETFIFRRYYKAG